MTEESNASQEQLPLDHIPDTDRPAAICALLFVSSGPVPLDAIARHLGCRPTEAASALEALEEQLDRLGLALQRCDEHQVQIITAPRLAPVVQRFLGLERTVRLSQAALETLAIVAYRQPVTRAELDAVRGVDSSGVLQTLIARGLVEPVGRLATVGNPIQYGTTPEFLRFFGLTSLNDLPPVTEAGPPTAEGESS
ncbi:MAG TPA: SMC-Scp complex subunit ScpB [Nitrolancea sp.]|nr:SMC-Scp complex subunit ScpB [Nitrolancea sp.]